ncbi:MAG TPA: phosphate ABC transporter substrate-binding protein PstS [Candidatus Sulfotelmatobacter sp.]|jgi:phosphate transport system substrate-binding protein|nr:phosphate ABC transporter substrate-binding protein PstS [Candidatus Sulfotelmatobacter sp.]
MSTSKDVVIRTTGISRSIFIISLIVVGAAGGTAGYFIPGLLKQSSSVITINGAGSSFVFPLMSAINANYTAANPNVQINYQSVGSGAGITDFSTKIVDFGATDAPLSGGPLGQRANITRDTGVPLTIPESIGAVAIAYNVKGVSTGLRLNATIAAMIFQGNITQWDDANIRAMNPGVTFPSSTITVVHRSDSSGTSFIFSSWLNYSNPLTYPWKLKVSKTPNWGGSTQAHYLSLPQNVGVAGGVQQNPNTIGYVELNYVLSTTPPMSYATVLNGDGNAFVSPTLKTSTNAVNNSTASLPTGDGDWSKVSLLNAHGGSSYPIVSFTYVLVFKELSVVPGMTQAKAQAFVNYLWFLVHSGQDQATKLSFVALPSSVVTVDEATIRLITYNSATLHS